MNCNVFLFAALCLSLVCVLLLGIKLRRVQESLSVLARHNLCVSYVPAPNSRCKYCFPLFRSPLPQALSSLLQQMHCEPCHLRL